MTDALPRRAKGQTYREYLTVLQAAGVQYSTQAKRSERRAMSRDVSRALPIPPRPKSHGEIALLVNAPRPMPHRIVTPRSGQLRRNTKRNARAAYWRTVKIRVSVQAEPYFLPSLHRLGPGVRVLGRTVLQDWFAVDYDVHLPGIPAEAVRAEPVFKSVFNGEYYEAQLDYVIWRDADGHAFNAETPEQMVEVVS